MVGFYGGEPLEYAGIAEQGSDAVPSTTGQVLGASFREGLAHNLTPRLIRSQGRFAAETGVILGGDAFAGGQPFMLEPETPLDAEMANAEFGVKGHLSFDKPVPRSIAKDLFDHKRDQIERDDIIARRETSLATGGVARFTMNLAASILDPINVAAAFIPVVGPAREAQLIAQASGAAARAGVRAGIGAGAGALGAAVLQPLEFALSRQEREDYTMADALRNIGLGTVLGGGLHVGVGAVIDRATGQYRNPLTQRLEDAGPEAREALLQGALAQTIEGRPVDVAATLDAVEAAPTRPKFSFEREAQQTGPIERDSNVYAIRDASGAQVARAHLTFEDGGSRGQIHYIDSTADGDPGRMLGQAAMREIGRAFFEANPDVQTLSGQRVSGARFGRDMNNLGDAEIVTVTREQMFRDRRAAIDNAAASARREEPPPRLEPDQAVRPSETLADIQTQIAELERMERPAAAVEPEPGMTRAADAEAPRSEADVAMEIAEARASAVDRAAFCITRGG